MYRIFSNVFKNPLRNYIRNYSVYGYNEEFHVEERCKLHINCPYNTYIKPVIDDRDMNRNKVFIQFNSVIPISDIDLKVWRNKEHLYIESDSEKGPEIKFTVLIPILADLFVTANRNGNINVEQLHGEHVVLSTESGNIVTENCNHVSVEHVSRTGNIVSNGTLKSINIKMETKESGCIVANHLQAVHSLLKTDEGDVRTQACYCDYSHFKTNTGKLILNNVHKNCAIDIADCGILQMTGFDGTLNVNMQEGEADIQLSKLHDESFINVKDKSPVLLRLSETIMDNTKIETLSPSLAVARTVKMIKAKDGQNIILLPSKSKYVSKLIVNSEKSHIVLEEASWADLMKLKNRNF